MGGQLSQGKLEEAGMRIFRHDGNDNLRDILKVIPLELTAPLVQDFLTFQNILSKEEKQKEFSNIPDILKGRESLFVAEARPGPEDGPTELKNYISKYPELNEADVIRTLAIDISDTARSIKSHDEHLWALFMNRFVFDKFHNMSREAEKMTTRRKLLRRELMEGFRIGSEHTWQHGAHLLEENRNMRGYSEPLPLTAPKPDLYFAFHIHTLPGGFFHDQNFKNKRYDPEPILNFSFGRMKDLAKLSERFSKKTETEANKEKRFHASHLVDFVECEADKEKLRVAFPWLIGEWKHAGVAKHEKEKVVLQAANGCAVALTMLAQLANGHSRPIKVDKIHPVFAITSVGSATSLWVAFIKDKAENDALSFQMHRVWRGDVAIQLYAIELCIFLDRLHAWAMDPHRRWIARCIGDWNDRLESIEQDTGKGSGTDGNGPLERQKSDTAKDSEGQPGAAIAAKQAHSKERITEPMEGFLEPMSQSNQSGETTIHKLPVQTAEYESVHDSDDSGDFHSAKEWQEATSSDSEPEASHPADQSNKSDLGQAPYPDLTYDPQLGPDLEQNAEWDDGGLKSEANENVMDSPYAEIRQPVLHQSEGINKQESPEATPLAESSHQQTGNFNMADLAAQDPFTEPVEHHNSFPTPIEQSSAAQDTTASTSSSGAEVNESPVTFQGSASPVPHHKASPTLYLGPKFIYVSPDKRFQFQFKGPLSPPSTPLNPMQQAPSNGSPVPGSNATLSPASGSTIWTFDSSPGSDSAPGGNPH